MLYAARNASRRRLNLMVILFVLLLLGILPVPTLTYSLGSTSAVPIVFLTVPSSGYSDFYGHYVEYMRWARIRALECLISLVLVHVSLIAALGTSIALSLKEYRKRVQRNEVRPVRKEASLAEWLIACAVLLIIAAIVIPSFVKSRSVSTQNMCINNLWQIDSGKEQAALAQHWGDTAAVVTTMVNIYMKGNTTPVCPSGGAYIYGRMDTVPKCDYVGSTVHRFGN